VSDTAPSTQITTRPAAEDVLAYLQAVERPTVVVAARTKQDQILPIQKLAILQRIEDVIVQAGAQPSLYRGCGQPNRILKLRCLRSG